REVTDALVGDAEAVAERGAEAEIRPDQAAPDRPVVLERGDLRVALLGGESAVTRELGIGYRLRQRAAAIVEAKHVERAAALTVQRAKGARTVPRNPDLRSEQEPARIIASLDS